jgi:hypothetical protein
VAMLVSSRLLVASDFRVFARLVIWPVSWPVTVLQVRGDLLLELAPLSGRQAAQGRVKLAQVGADQPVIQRGAAHGRRLLFMVPLGTDGSVVQHAPDSRGEPGPAGAEGRQALSSGLGDGVVTPCALALLVPPFAGDQARVA